MKTYDASILKETPYTRLTIGCSSSDTHAHSFFEFAVILNGQCLSSINHAPSDLLSKGDVIFVRPGDCHNIQECSLQYRHRDFYVDIEKMKKICIIFSDTFFDEMMSRKQISKFRLNADEFSVIENKAKFLGQVNFNLGANSPYLDQLHTSIIIDLLCKLIIFKINEANNIPAWLEDLYLKLTSFDYIDFSIDEIIRSTQYSHGYICQMFKKYYHTSLIAYHNRNKILYSCSLLSQMKIIDIASRLGWDNPKNYALEFKKVFNISPIQYKKCMRDKP